MSLPQVEVLMSTYNGQKYLNEQVSSILSQKDVDVSLLVRDDGSSDQTTVMLDEYQQRGLLRWYTGENLRPARSFLHLLSHAGPFDYYAFSDQDDYWNPEKLAAAVERLREFSGVPALYFCQTQLADSQLNPIDTPHIHPLLTFGESLVYQFVGGCTMVMNARLRDIVCKYTPDYLPMHDVWIYVVSLGVGAKVVFDSEPHILYRQHGGNVVGQGFGWQTVWKRRFDRIVRDKEHVRYCLAKEVQTGFSELITDNNRPILEKFLAGRHSLWSRLSLLTDSDYHCGNHHVYRNFQVSVLLNTY